VGHGEDPPAIADAETRVQPPALTIGPTQDRVVVAWPAAAIGFRLEATAGLGTADAWKAVPAAPAVVDGMNTVAEPIPQTSRFYRLRLQ
jgi:hypothetical protein